MTTIKILMLIASIVFPLRIGGALALSLCMYIQHEHTGTPPPGKLVLQSPGLQVPPGEEQKEEMKKREKTDIMIPPRFFDSIAPVLAEGDEAYLLSPILFDLTGFPPIDIFYGTREEYFKALQ